MKKVGIVGGIAWPSTVEYYTGLCQRGEALCQSGDRHAMASMPEIAIESLDHDRAVAFLGNDEDETSWIRFDEYHRAALQRLERSGANFALIASNTSHHRFVQITRGIGIPVLNIFEIVARECARIQARQVLILGTASTMDSPLFREAFAAHGIRASGPDQSDAKELTVRLSEELQHGTDNAAAVRLGDIARMCRRQFTTPPAVCLACTELPLAFPKHKTMTSFDLGGIRYINSTALHIQAAFNCAVSEA